jgi:hypothetical protein
MKFRNPCEVCFQTAAEVLMYFPGMRITVISGTVYLGHKASVEDGENAEKIRNKADTGRRCVQVLKLRWEPSYMGRATTVAFTITVSGIYNFPRNFDAAHNEQTLQPEVLLSSEISLRILWLHNFGTTFCFHLQEC